MRPLGVVEANPVIDDPLGLEAVGDFMQINGLLLEGSPEPFDEDVVKVAPPSIHRDFDFSFGQCLNPIRARVLAALIRVHDLGLAIFGNSLLQRFNTKAGVQRI